MGDLGNRPILLTPPSISAPDGWIQGQQIIATAATWDNADSVAKYWTRNGVIIAEAEGANRALTEDDVGSIPGYREVATNADGSRTASVVGEVVEAGGGVPENVLTDGAGDYLVDGAGNYLVWE